MTFIIRTVLLLHLFQDQVGWGPRQPDLVDGNPAHRREVGT